MWTNIWHPLLRDPCYGSVDTYLEPWTKWNPRLEEYWCKVFFNQNFSQSHFGWVVWWFATHHNNQIHLQFFTLMRYISWIFQAVSNKTTAEEEILIYPLSLLVNRKTDQYSIRTFVLEFGILEAYKPIYMPPLQTSKKVSLRNI